MKNNIIIAGVPRAGKSTVSHILSQEYGYQHVSIPFYMSVDGEYSFYAIDTEDNGAILSGYEPEFEEADKVADIFEDFMSKVLSGDIVL